MDLNISEDVAVGTASLVDEHGAVRSGDLIISLERHCLKFRFLEIKSFSLVGVEISIFGTEIPETIARGVDILESERKTVCTGVLNISLVRRGSV